jgi:hypothetical protein
MAPEQEYDVNPWVTVIGRGHSGTRAMSQTLAEGGVFMGAPLNDSWDLLPPEDMYDACRVIARDVKWKGGLEWDWTRLHTMDIPEEFTRLLGSFLKSVLESKAVKAGWKLPETTLCYPWIRRLYPEMKYVFWIRNPRDCILNGHVTDDLRDFDIAYPEADDIRRRRAISWIYQYKLVKATPRPAQWIEVRFEDFVLDQDRTLRRLEEFLGMKLTKIPVKPEAVGRYKTDTGENYFDFFALAMSEYGYEIP